MRRQLRTTSSHRFKNVRRSSGVPRLTGWHTIWHIETRTYNDLAQSEKKRSPRLLYRLSLSTNIFVTYKIFILLLHLYNKLLSSCCADVTQSFVMQRNKEKRDFEKLWERTTIWSIIHQLWVVGISGSHHPPSQTALECFFLLSERRDIHNQSLFQASPPDTSSYQGYLIMDR